MIKIEKIQLLQNKAFINGQFCDAINNRTFKVANPYDHQVIANVANCGVKETRLAIEHAHNALSKWKQLTGIERGRILRKWYDLQMEYLEDLATILTMEQGKPRSEAKAEIVYGASFVEWFSEEAKRVYGDTIPAHERNMRIRSSSNLLGL